MIGGSRIQDILILYFMIYVGNVKKMPHMPLIEVRRPLFEDSIETPV